MIGVDVEGDESELAPVAARSVTAARLCEKLTDILKLIDRFDEARSAAPAGLELVPARETLQAARLQCLLSRAEFQAACHDAGMAAHLASEELVGTPGLDDSQERVELWLYLQMTDALII